MYIEVKDTIYMERLTIAAICCHGFVFSGVASSDVTPFFRRNFMEVRTGRLSARWKIVLILLPVVTALMALGIGRYFITPAEVLEAIAGRFTGSYEISQMAYKTVWNLRIPRILLALLVGAASSMAS